MTAMLATPIRASESVTVKEVMDAMEAAHARSGYDGYFSLALYRGRVPECHVFHWHKPDPYAFEKNDTVCSGTLIECLEALDGYAAERAANAQQEAA